MTPHQRERAIGLLLTAVVWATTISYLIAEHHGLVP